MVFSLLWRKLQVVDWDCCVCWFSLTFLVLFSVSPTDKGHGAHLVTMSEISHLLGSDPCSLLRGFCWCVCHMCYNLSNVGSHGQAGKWPWSPVPVFSVQPWPHNCYCSPEPLSSSRFLVFLSCLFSPPHRVSSVFPYPLPILLSAWGLFILTQEAFSWSILK